MQPPLGDRLFDLAVMIFFAWAMGWTVLLSVSTLQYVFPNRAEELEWALQSSRKAVEPILKYTGLAILFLLVVWFLAS